MRFISIFLRCDGYWHQILTNMRGGAQGGFNATMLESLSVPLPPLEEQERIASILTEQMAAIDKARAAAQEQLDTLQALPAAILRQAFNGEL